MALIKMSVGFMLLRLEQEVAWRRFLWVLIALQGILAIYNTATQLTRCIPLSAIWEFLRMEPSKCWSIDSVRINIICTSSIHIATDFIFALLPISFLRKVQRPLRERLVIGVLMALGIVAGAASTMKLANSLTFGRSRDLKTEGIKIGLWSVIEELVGFIAACIPCLRQPFQRVLERLRIISPGNADHDREYGHMYEVSGNMKGRAKKSGSGNVIKLMNVRGQSNDDESEENILGGGDDMKSGEIWLTTELRLEEERSRQVSRAGPRVGKPELSWSDTSANRSHRR